MGVMTTSRKRPVECMNLNHHLNTISPSPIPSDSHRKRLRFSSTQAPSVSSLTATGSRISRYPEPKQPLRREVHAPCRPRKFDLPNRGGARVTGSSRKEEEVAEEMGNFLLRNYRNAKHAALDYCRHLWKGKKEVIELDSDSGGYEEVSDDSRVEEAKNNGEIGGEGRSLVTDQRWQGSDGVVVEVQDVEIADAKVVDGGNSTSSRDSELTNSGLKVVNDIATGKAWDGSLARIPERDIADIHVYKKLLEDVNKRDDKIKWLNFNIELEEKRKAGFDLLRPKKEIVEEVPHEPFVALKNEEEDEVTSAFSANRRKILVMHKDSNIEISGEKFQCLRPGAWLNDEVINLYLELLKEREKRDPQKFLKCHFFSTFFYKKLISGKNGYDFKSVRRWTSQRKLGYGLIECDKIFVPIHKEIHWCLAVINKKDKKFQYLDSLRGMDNQVLKVLARYFVDEVKDKTGKDIDVSSWEKEFVADLPEQENGFDCGVFMIKYADFYSRGLGLCFDQEHMPYFRRRTAKEILRLRAD